LYNSQCLKLLTRIRGGIMLGYEMSDINEMINAVHDAKLFYLRTPSDLIDKEPLVKSLEKTNDFLQGLWAEGYFDGYQD
jgi:hypothetical protein